MNMTVGCRDMQWYVDVITRVHLCTINQQILWGKTCKGSLSLLFVLLGGRRSPAVAAWPETWLRLAQMGGGGGGGALP